MNIIRPFLISILGLLFININLSIANPIEITVLKIADHPALDQTVKGIQDYFFKNHIEANILVESAQGQVVNAKQIANKFISKQPDLIIAVATPAAQAFISNQFKSKNKIIFTSVTDPEAAGLVNATTKTNFIGISNYIPVETQLQYFIKHNPQLKKLGTIYNPSQINSAKLTEMLKLQGKAHNLEIYTAYASKTSEIAQATQSLVKKVDAIFINNDNVALSALTSIIGIANKHKIPVYCSDIDTFDLGVSAAIGADQFELGEQTAELAWMIYRGKKIKSQIFYPKSIKALTR